MINPCYLGCGPRVYHRVGRIGGEGTRTPDPLLAKQVLYQLSYTPECDRPSIPLLGVPGFEPGTSALSELRSSQLSYTPDPNVNHQPDLHCRHPQQTQKPNRRVWLSADTNCDRESYLTCRW